MRPVVSVDLAYKQYRDVGIAVLRAAPDRVVATFTNPGISGLVGEPQPEQLAHFLADLASSLGSTMLLLDGPQGWRRDDSEIAHCRRCERVLHTPAKTGLPGQVKPANYGPYVAFCVAVFDALDAMGWPRCEGAQLQAPTAYESFPMAAWKQLGLPMLPAKAKSTDRDLSDRLERLAAIVPLELDGSPNHDELQALVAGLGGIGLQVPSVIGAGLHGEAPFVSGGWWREGFILTPARAGV